ALAERPSCRGRFAQASSLRRVGRQCLPNPGSQVIRESSHAGITGDSRTQEKTYVSAYGSKPGGRLFSPRAERRDPSRTRGEDAMTDISKAGTFALGDRTVKRMGYGAMQLAGPGVFGPPKDHDGAIAVLREAVASGVDHIDTSDFYGPHVTNQIIREALHPYPDDLTIVTKIGARRGPDAAWLPATAPAELQSAVHDNLRNLGLDALEVVNLRITGNVHGPAEGPIEAPLTVLAELQRQGLVRHIGLSNVTAAQIAEGRRICESSSGGGISPLRPHRTGRETLASSGSYTPASGRAPSRHRTNRLGQVGVPSRDAPQPVHRCSFSTLEPLEFPPRPSCESLIKVAEHLNALRAVEPPIVVHPSPHRRVGQAGKVLQSLVVPGGRHSPIADGLPDRLGGLGADRRQEADEILPPAVLRASRLEGVAEEVELDMFVASRPVAILAVHDPGLLMMKLQAALRKATSDGFPHRSGFLLAPAVDDG